MTLPGKPLAPTDLVHHIGIAVSGLEPGRRGVLIELAQHEH